MITYGVHITDDTFPSYQFYLVCFGTIFGFFHIFMIHAGYCMVL